MTERIVTRCPTCDFQTLFVGSGGHLTCSRLECSNPSVASSIAKLKSAESRADALSEKLGAACEVFDCKPSELTTRIRQAESRADAAERDAKRLDWLEQQGMIGIGHIGYGDYRLYAGKGFPKIREVVDAALREET